MKANKLCILAPVHDWDDVRVFKKQARSAAEFGYDVTLIAQSDSEKMIDGIKVIPAPFSRYRRFVRLFMGWRIFLIAFKLNADIYHLHNPDTIPVAWLLKLFSRKVIYDTHEDFTKRLLQRKWLPSPSRRFLAFIVGWLEFITSRVVDFTIVTQENVMKRLGKNAVMILNLPRVSNDVQYEAKRYAERIEVTVSEFRLIYIGALSESRGLFEMVSSLSYINEHINCRLWLIGPADSADLEKAKRINGWEYVDYHEKMKQEKAFGFVLQSDVGLIYIRDVGDHSKSDPNKVYEYMAFSKPFIASDFEKWRMKYACLKAGSFVKPGSAELLAKAVLKMAAVDKKERELMGDRGYTFVLNNNWDGESKKLMDLYGKLS
ncbi:MAG: glycosyltransferase [Oceanospirillaceae bacterium]|nr:glycosyltransferase [Oceanospirillaceae bacterium]